MNRHQSTPTVAVSTPSRPDWYRRDIDGLRGVAVLGVLFYHFDFGFPGGFSGVDAFFVISGYVVTQSLMRREVHSPLSIIGFYKSRIKRLYPALLAVVLVSVALTWLLVPPLDMATVLGTGAAAVVGLSNWQLLSTSVDYFSITAENNFFTQTWSLGVEEQFYLLVAPLTLFVRSRRFVFGLVLLFSGVSLATWFLASPQYSFFASTSRAWELGLGVLLANARQPDVSSRVTRVLRLCGGLLIATAFLSETAATLLAVLGTTILVGIPPTSASHGAHRSSRTDFPLLTTRTLVFVGLVSYSLYLWHWPVVVSLRWTVGMEGLLQRIAGIVISVGVAVASYQLIERPLRYRSWFRRDASLGERTVSVSVIALVFVSFAYLSIIGTRSLPSRAEDFSGGETVPVALAFNDVGEDSPSDSLGSDCWFSSEKTDSEWMMDCLVDPLERPSVFVVGDSHAERLLVGLRRAIDSTDGEYQHLGYLGNRVEGDLLAGVVPGLVRDLVAEGNRGDVMVFTMHRAKLSSSNEMRTEQQALVDPVTKEKMSNLELSLGQLAELLDAAGMRLLLVDDGPSLKLKQASSACLAGGRILGTQPCATLRELSLEDRAPMTSVFQRVAQVYSNVLYIDPHPVACPEQMCEVTFPDGKLAMTDWNHMSNTASDRLAPLFQSALSYVDR